jgi:CubicO group peptidase (beta-lactamase class C family)
MGSRVIIALLALLPAPLLVAGCHERVPATQARAPLSEAALAAVSADAGAPREELARRIDALFTAPDMGETRALIVMHDGRVAAERYGRPYTRKTRLVGWSMSKTITGVLIGMLVADGKLKLDETPPIPNWQRPGDPRGAITLRQLLQMRSGLRHVETGDPAYDSDTVRMLFLQGRDDMASYAEAQPVESRPGTVYEYSTATTVILDDVAARVLTNDNPDPAARRRAVDDYLKARLFAPLGMTSMVPEYDAAGTLIGGSLIHGTARDWARFGEFLRHDGATGGVQLVPKSWIAFMESPSPRAPDYGAQLWLNRPSGTDRHELFAEDGPRDLVAMIGHLGQYVLVSPSRHLVIVRLGKTDDGTRDPVVAQLGRIVALYPAES